MAEYGGINSYDINKVRHNIFSPFTKQSPPQAGIVYFKGKLFCDLFDYIKVR